MTAARGLDRLGSLGQGLVRPECVRVGPGGDVFASDGRGGVMRLRADGDQELVLGRGGDLREPLVPNGIHVEADGSFLVAHLGTHEGGVFRLGRDGALSPMLRDVDGIELPPTNYVTRDNAGRVWVTVSTMTTPRHLDYSRDARTGFIARVDARGDRIVADGLGYTNECAVSPDGCWLYATETFARRLSRFPILVDGDLGDRETVATFGEGEFPDGIHLDGDVVWVACIVGNRLLRVGPDGSYQVALDGSDPAFVADVEREYRGSTMSRENMYRVGDSPLGNISSVTADPTRRSRLILGSLLGTSLLTFDVDRPR